MMQVRMKGFEELKKTLRSVRTAFKHDDDRVLWGFIFNVMGLIYKKRFKEAQAYKMKKRPFIYGSQNLIKSGKMYRALTEKRNMFSHQKKFRGRAEIGYRGLEYINWVSGGVPNRFGDGPRNPIPIRTRRAKSPQHKLVWIGDKGYRHSANFSMDKRPTIIPARPILIAHKNFSQQEIDLLDDSIKKYFHRKFKNIK